MKSLNPLNPQNAGTVRTVNGTAPDENGNVNVAGYTLPTAGKDKLGGVKTTSTVTSASGLTPVPIIGGVPYYKNTTYSAATTSAAGLLSAADKKKLDSVSDGAGSLNMTLLWTNSDVDGFSVSADQYFTISGLELSGYTAILYSYVHQSNKNYEERTIIKVGETVKVPIMNTAHIAYWREVIVDSTSVKVGYCYYAASTAGNSSMGIPYKIYGLK